MKLFKEITIALVITVAFGVIMVVGNYYCNQDKDAIYKEIQSEKMRDAEW